MNEVYLLIGGNMGNRLSYFNAAKLLIEIHIGKIVLESSIYETEAWGIKNQSEFLNQCLKIESKCSPKEILIQILKIEETLGRIRSRKFGPRYIDIDILFYNNKIIKTEQLTIPHPEIQNRKFALIPLLEISSTLIHPVLGQNMTDLLENCTDILDVKKFSGTK